MSPGSAKGLCTAAFVWVAVAACAADRTRSEGAAHLAALHSEAAGPALRLVDTVLLRETDSLHLGRPGLKFAVDDRGALYVPDELQDHIVRFGPTGAPEFIFGRRGQGPGELAAIGSTFVIDTFVVQFHRTRSVAIYSRTTGTLLTSRMLRGYATSIAKSAEHVWIGTFDLESRRGLAVVQASRLFRQAEESDFEVLQATVAPFPSQYARFPGLDIFNWVSVMPMGRGALVGFAGGTNELYLADSAKGVTDTVVIPFARRRGVSQDALPFFAPRSRAGFEEQLGSVSALQGLWPASRGRGLIWYQDNSARVTRKGHSDEFTGRAYLSILSADATTVCVDVEVPFPGSHWPRLAFSRDTLYALDQIVPDTGPPRVYSVVRRYVLDDNQCEWLPTTPRL